MKRKRSTSKELFKEVMRRKKKPLREKRMQMKFFFRKRSTSAELYRKSKKRKKELCKEKKKKEPSKEKRKKLLRMREKDPYPKTKMREVFK